MELRTLLYFIAVATQLSFSRAAETLFISQPNLSEQIASLESELGTNLFIRNKRSISLTPAGKVLLSGAQALILDEQNLAERVKNIGNALPQTYRLSLCLEEPVIANSDVCQSLIKVTLSFKERYNPLRLVMDHEEKPLRASKLGEKNADIFFCISSAPHWSSRYAVRILSEDHFVLAVSKIMMDAAGTINSMEFLERYPLFMLENEGQGLLEICKMLNSLGCHPDIRFCKSNAAIELQIAAGEGVALVPKKKAQQINTAYLELPVDKSISSVNLYALYLTSNTNELIPVFLDELEKLL